MSKFKKIIFFLLIAGSINNTYSQNFSKRKINNLKNQVSQMVEDDKKDTQVMVDKVFSFAENDNLPVRWLKASKRI
jgi:aminobenzoyl-glutamate utilization protein B